MTTVGLTGGIASGKSRVCAFFKSYGAAVVDADIIAREIVMPDLEGWQRVVKRFGNDILLPDRNINREALGRIVFSDQQARAELDSFLHPIIIERIRSGIEGFKDTKIYPVIIADVPLLIECGMQNDFDKIILVYSDRESQIKRLIQRDPITAADAEKRVNSQMPMEKKKAFADIIINNDGSLKDLEKKVEQIYWLLSGTVRT